MRWIAVGLLMCAPVPVAAVERLRVYVGEQGVTGRFVSSGHGEAESVKHLQKRLAKTFDVVASMKDAHFGVIVLGRGEGEEELRGKGLGSDLDAEHEATPGRPYLPRDSVVRSWLVVDIASSLHTKHRFIARKPASVSAYEDCASMIVKDIRSWAEENTAALVATRAGEAGP